MLGEKLQQVITHMKILKGFLPLPKRRSLNPQAMF
jgi:hypothetical protein